MAKQLRGQGGPGVKIMIFFVLTYVLALVMRILKWAHTPSSSRRLSFCGSWREAHTRSFSRKTGKNQAKKGLKINFQTISFGTRDKSRPNFGFGRRYGYYIVPYRAGFLKFDFFGILWPLEGRIFAIFQIFASNSPLSCQ